MTTGNGLSGGGGGNCKEGATTGITVSRTMEAASNKMGRGLADHLSTKNFGIKLGAYSRLVTLL